MNNPMSQMADAQKLTITQLQQSLRNGTIDPQVGQIVLASKIKQAKEAKAAMAAQMPKQPPVAQQNMAYGQGVDTLASNLPTVSAAQGGIISFAGGGLGTEEDSVYRRMYGQEPDQFGNIVVDGKLVNIRDLPISNLGKVGQAPVAPTRTSGLTSVPTSPFGRLPSGSVNEKAYQNTQLRDPASWSVPSAVPTAATAPVSLRDWQKTAPAAEAAPAKEKAVVRDTIGEASPRTSAPASQGIAGGYKITPYDDKELKAMLESEMNPATGKPWTYEEKAAENRRQGKEAGIDYDVYKSQREELDKLKEKSAKRSKLDEAMPWFAASEAFARQPKAGEAPQSAIGAITGALGAYGKSATELDEKELVRQDKLRSEGNALALAQNAFNQAQFSGNKADLKEAQSAVRTARTNLANLGVETTKAQNKVAEDVYKAQADMDRTQVSAAASRYAADKAQNTINSIADAIQADNTGISRSEAIKQAYEISNPGFAAIGQRDVASQRATITKQIAELNKNYSLKPDEKKAKLAALNMQLELLNANAGTVDNAGTIVTPAGASGFVDRTKY